MIDKKKQGKKNRAKPTLDRIDNSKGYTKNNVMIISQSANGLKSDMPMEVWNEIKRKIITR